MNSEGKRLREDDDYPPQEGRGGADAPQSDQDAKRTKQDPSVELITNVCKDLRRIGETANLQQQVDDLAYIANPIVIEFENLPNFRTSVLETIRAVVLEQPQKIQALALLIWICNAKNFLVPKYVVEYLHTELSDSLNKRNFTNIKSILKFFGALAPIVDGLEELLSQFIELASSLNDAKLSAQVFHNIAVAIPYVLANDPSNTELVSRLIEKLKAVQLAPQSAELYEVIINEKSTLVAEAILPSLEELRDGNYEQTNKLFINYADLVAPIVEASLKENKISNELVRHKLPQLAIDAESIASIDVKEENYVDWLWTQSPQLVLEVYSTVNELETVPKRSSYTYLAIRDAIIDLITGLVFNKNELAVQIAALDLFFGRDLFAPPGLSIDTLTQVHQDNVSGANSPALSTWKIEDLVVETVLSLLFGPRTKTIPNIFFHSVLVGTCRDHPMAMAPVFGRAFRYFYRHATSLDLDYRTRFADWMAVQVANFDFSWKWEEWAQDAEDLAKLRFHPTNSFIRQLITKEMKLGNKKKVEESLGPEVFHKYLNQGIYSNESKFIISYDSEIFGQDDHCKETIAKLQFERAERRTASTQYQLDVLYVFGSEKLPYHHGSDKLYKFLLTNNRSPREYHEIVQETLDEVTGDNIDKVKFIVNLIIQSYCYIGSRSIYSTISIMARDIGKLKWLAGVELTDQDYSGIADEFRFGDSLADHKTLQGHIVDAVLRIWSHHAQFAFLILEFLVTSNVVLFDVLADKCIEPQHNLAVALIDSYEVIERLSTKPENATKIVSNIIDSLNTIVEQLGQDEVAVEELTEENVQRVDTQWLYFEYVGLFRAYWRNSTVSPELLDAVTNDSLRAKLASFADQKY